MPHGLQFMAERGILAVTPGEALDQTLVHLAIDQTKIQRFKAWTEIPDKLSDFSEDTQMLSCPGTRYTVKEIWHKRYS